MEKPETSFKDMNAKQKIGYIWDYYKPLLLVIAIIVVFFIYVLYAHFHPGAESICNVVLMDVESYGTDDDVFTQYLEENGYDTDAFTINTTFIDTSTYNAQLLAAELLTGEVDIIIGDSTVMQNLLDSGALDDLDEIFDGESAVEYTDETYAETDSDGVEHIYAICLPGDNEIIQNGYYTEDVWVGISTTAANRDEAMKLIRYLLSV